MILYFLPHKHDIVGLGPWPHDRQPHARPGIAKQVAVVDMIWLPINPDDSVAWR